MTASEDLTTPQRPNRRMLYVVLGLVVLFVVVAATISLTRGPSTRTEVCASFDELGARVRAANGFWDNAVFRQAGSLAEVADRFPGPPDLSVDVDALKAIADADETSAVQLMAATRRIANLCGHPLRVLF